MCYTKFLTIWFLKCHIGAIVLNTHTTDWLCLNYFFENIEFPMSHILHWIQNIFCNDCFWSKNILKVILPSTIPPCWQSSSQSNTFWSGWKIKLASELPGDYSVLTIGWKSSLFEKTKFSKTFPPTTNEMVQGQFASLNEFLGVNLMLLLL